MKTNAIAMTAVVKSIARAYSLRGEVIARAKKEGALNEGASKVTHSKVNATVRLSETYNVPSTFTLSDDERKALAIIRSFEAMNKLTGLSMELLKEASKPEKAKTEGAQNVTPLPKTDTTAKAA